jgi:hypothetical protein
MNEKKIENHIGGSVKGIFMGGDNTGSNISYTENQGVVPSDSDQIEVKELLTKLRDAVETDSNLNPDQKKALLEQVKVVEDAINNPKEENKKKQAETVVNGLKFMLNNLLPASKILEEFNKLLPLIAKFWS